MNAFGIIRMRAILLVAAMVLLNPSWAREPDRVEPPFWWAGMAHTGLQLMVHAPDIGATRVEVRHPGIRILETVAVDSPNYLFITMDIADALPGKIPLEFRSGDRTLYSYEYELKPREEGSRYRMGFNASDAVYLLMPDRFANGDPANDDMPGMLERADRSNPDGRHGGDIQGIINHLDHIADMGFSALWINPLLENNQPRYSYHGYATTDFYRIDPRLGTNGDYRRLVDLAAERGIKVIKDMIFNHCGDRHWWMADLPSPDWLNQWDGFTRTTYRMTTLIDPHGAQADQARMVKGWFDHHMPDLNQRNRLLATYLIQNSVWWIEFAGIQGIRMDTQPYADRDFMSEWGRYVMAEYPNFMIVGEAWTGMPAVASYFQGGKQNHDGYDSHIPSVFDFSLYDAIGMAFRETQGWDSGMMRLYNSLARDFLYPDPYNLVVFGDNHDTDRFFTRVGEDVNKLKMALTLIFTTRGIPQMYSGTELLESAWEHDGHGHMRTNFPGGWPGDPVNAFTEAGRSREQNEVVGHITTLLQYRRNNPVMHYGWLKHFVPEDNVYVYFRYHGREAVMVVLNNNDRDHELDLSRFHESLQGFTGGTDILTGRRLDGTGRWVVPARASMVVELF